MTALLQYAEQITNAQLAGDFVTLGALAITLLADRSVLQAELDRLRGADEVRRAGQRDRTSRSRGSASPPPVTLPAVDGEQLALAIDGRDAGECHVTSRYAALHHVASAIPFPPTPPKTLLLTTTGRASAKGPSQPPPAPTKPPESSQLGVETGGKVGESPPDHHNPASVGDFLVAAANRGLETRWGPKAGTLVPCLESETMAALVRESGSELAGVLALVERRASTTVKHPQRFAYFRPAIVDYCTKATSQRRADRARGSLPPSLDRLAQRPTTTTAVPDAVATQRMLESIDETQRIDPAEAATIMQQMREEFARAGARPPQLVRG